MNNRIVVAAVGVIALCGCRAQTALPTAPSSHDMIKARERVVARRKDEVVERMKSIIIPEIDLRQESPLPAIRDLRGLGKYGQIQVDIRLGALEKRLAESEADWKRERKPLPKPNERAWVGSGYTGWTPAYPRYYVGTVTFMAQDISLHDCLTSLCVGGLTWWVDEEMRVIVDMPPRPANKGKQATPQ